MKNVERCTVSLVGTPRTKVGPTPFESPFLANELALQLLDELPASLPGSTIRFDFTVRSLLTFSWELRKPALARLAQLGARLEFCVNDDEPGFDRLGAYRTELELRIGTHDRDPDEVTTRLGREPTRTYRVGQPLELGGTRLCKRNVWIFEVVGLPPTEVSGLATALCDSLPAEAPAVCNDYATSLRLDFMIDRLAGGFALEAPVVARLAALGAPLACYLYNQGA